MPKSFAFFLTYELIALALTFRVALADDWSGLGPFSEPVVVYHNDEVAVSAGDPSVIYDSFTGVYRMVISCLHSSGEYMAICEATSPNGMDWTLIPSPHPEEGVPGLILPPAAEGEWDHATEVPNIVRVSATDCRLYYSDSQIDVSIPTKSGVATSTDCVHFTRYPGNPILPNGPEGPDAFDAYLAQHPAVIRESANLWWMTYTCDPSSTDPANIMSICLARSTNGFAWEKLGRVLDAEPSLEYMTHGAGEAGGFFKHSDGYYYLAFTGFIDDPNRPGENTFADAIGIARALSPLGPWDINPAPLVRYKSAPWNEGAVITPTVRVEGDVLRLWFNGMNADFDSNSIGYTSGHWPF